MYQKILVPVDGSEHSKRALKEAINLAKMTEGNITLLTVYPSGSLSARAISALTNEQRLVESEGIPVDTLLAKGNVVDQIIRTAKEGHFDLIVIGARGLSRLQEIVLGSVSRGVTENAPCPVIVTR